MCSPAHALRLAGRQVPEPIDFAAFRKELASAPGVVDLFEKAYGSITLPKYEGKEGDALLAKFAELTKEATAAETAAKARIAELEAQLKVLAVEKANIKTLTIDEVLAGDAPLAAELNKEIISGKWY